MRVSPIRHNFLVVIAMVGLTVFFVTSAHAGYVEFENWGTQFSPNPMVCNTGTGCTVMQTQTNILPHTHPTFTVDRTATIDVTAGRVSSPKLRHFRRDPLASRTAWGA